MSKRSHGKLETLFHKNGWSDEFSIQDSGIGNVILPKESGKGNAMQRWAKILKLSVKDLLVVGDQPEEGGNDEDFISGRNGIGFSVGGSTPYIYPLSVLSEAGTRLLGPEGTTALLGQVRWEEV